MVDKSKMSVADILAAARKAGPEGQVPAQGSVADVAPAEREARVAEDKPGAPAPAAKKPAGGHRPSVADILTAARGQQPGVATAPVPPQAKEKSAAKPAAPKPSRGREASARTDTQSILAAARGSAKHGPMTKAEAASKAAPPPGNVKKANTAEIAAVPPMPVRPDYAKLASERGARSVSAERRALLFGMSALAVGFFALGTTMSAWALAAVRFMFPNILREPPSQFTVGFPDEFSPGHVETKFLAQYGVWIVNTEFNGELQISALKSVCTHLGCTPNWLEAEQKFKCPCHGSGFYKDGINFEGPAPRPLERYAISIAGDGRIQVDKSRTFQEELGQWSDPSSYIPV